MELNINSPIYFSNHFGVDDDIYWMCRNIREYMKDRKYSDTVDIIGICPIVEPDKPNDQRKCCERIEYHLSSKLIIVSLHINFLRYVNGSIDERKKLMIGNILKSVKSVKSKGNIDYLSFESDLLDFVGYQKADIISDYF